MRSASQLLHALGVMPEHEAYMEKHAHNLMNLMHGNAPGPKEEGMENFKNFYIQEAKMEVSDTNTQHEHLTEPAWLQSSSAAHSRVPRAREWVRHAAFLAPRACRR